MSEQAKAQTRLVLLMASGFVIGQVLLIPFGIDNWEIALGMCVGAASMAAAQCFTA